MIHLGDITKINGAAIEPVDCITGGSPCQDLSVAGKRAGLAGDRSGLFMEQIRIVKEMRDHDRSIGRSGVTARPRHMVWENVPGAFSSNGGKDFQAVLTEIVRIAEPEAPDVPMPDKGKWPKAGCLYDAMGRWSVAWRLHDAQFWGVAQRRKRIALVADFGGMSAPEVLFDREGLSGNFDTCGEKRESSAGAVEDRSGTASGFDGYNATLTGEKQATIGVNCGISTGRNGVIHPVFAFDKSATLSTLQDQTLIAFTQNQQNEVRDLHDVSGALAAKPGMKQQTFIAFIPGAGAKAGSIGCSDTVSTTLESSQCDFMSPCIAYNIGSYHSNAWLSDNPNSGVYETDKSKTLDALNCGSPTCNQGGTAVVQCLDMTHANDVIRECGDIAPTLQSRMGTGANQVPLVAGPVCIGNGQTNQAAGEIAGALNCMHDQQAVYIPDVSKALKSKGNCDFREDSETYVVSRLDCRNGRENGDLCGTLQSHPNGGFNCTHPVRIGSIVRRLTPLECERLQGFPDGWTDIGEWVDSAGKRHKPADTPRYKALGNSIAVGYANNRSGFWCWLMRRISAQYERAATLGSLFDGIGGFPLAWEAVNGRGTARWASEIEEFPIAVTKFHFGEELMMNRITKEVKQLQRKE